MNPADSDAESTESLLRRYRGTGDEAALRALIARYLPLVFSAARRRTASDAMAADVTQAVFCDFARQARKLPDGFQPGGWLWRHTGFLSSRALRTERRRAAREAEAARLIVLESSELMTNATFPDLDAALHRLPAADQAVLILKFYEGQELPAIAARLGVSSAAVQKRIERALGRLRKLMPVKAAMPTVVSALAAFLSQEKARAALPPDLLTRVNASAISAAGRPLSVLSVWLRHLGPVGGALAGSAAALMVSAVPLVPLAVSRSGWASEAESAALPASHPVVAAPETEMSAADIPTAASVVDELIALVDREGYNRIAYNKAESLIAKIPREECGEAVLLVTRAFPTQRIFANRGGPERWPDILLWRWNPDAPDEALSFLLPKLASHLRDPVAMSLCQRWYRRDPAAATAWWHRLLNDTPSRILPEDCRKIVVRRLGYWVLESLQQENPLLAAGSALRMEEQGIESLVPTQSSRRLFELAKRADVSTIAPAPDREVDLKLSRRVFANHTASRVAEALTIKDEALRDYTLAAMIARDLDSADTFGRDVLKSAALPLDLATRLREWLALPP